MSKYQIYSELREIGYDKAKALKLAKKSELSFSSEYFYFSDRGHRYIVNTRERFIMRLDCISASGYYGDFWEKVCA